MERTDSVYRSLMRSVKGHGRVSFYKWSFKFIPFITYILGSFRAAIYMCCHNLPSVGTTTDPDSYTEQLKYGNLIVTNDLEGWANLHRAECSISHA